MVLMAALGTVLLGAVLLHYFWVAQRKLIVGPETFFLLMGVGTFATTVYLAAQAGAYAHPYAVYIGLGLLCFTGGTFAGRFVLRFRHRRELLGFQSKPWSNDLAGLRFSTVAIIGFVSLGITFAYFYLLGYFVPYEAVRTLLSPEARHVSTVYNELRRASGNTGTYLFAGYVFQFKNCLLPLVTIVLYYKARLHPTWFRYSVFLFFLGSTVLAAVGTGSRFAFAFFAGTFVIVGFAPYMAPYRFRLQQAILGVAGPLVVLSGLTLLMGARGQQKISEHPLLWAPFQLLNRIFVLPATERFEIYEMFLAGKKPLWGAGTLSQLRIALPGRQEYTLSNQLHELLYGSPTGNVALDIWGSLWYDFHWLGLAALFLFGFACHGFYVWMIRGPKQFIRVIVLAYAGIVLGLTTDLQVLILRGFFTCLVLLLLVRVARAVEISFAREVPA